MWDTRRDARARGRQRRRSIAELKAELEREQGKLRALQDIGQALGSTLDLDELVGILLARITRIMDADQATLYLLDEAGGELWSRFSHGGRAQEIRLALGQGLPGWVGQDRPRAQRQGRLPGRALRLGVGPAHRLSHDARRCACR